MYTSFYLEFVGKPLQSEVSVNRMWKCEWTFGKENVFSTYANTFEIIAWDVDGVKFIASREQRTITRCMVSLKHVLQYSQQLYSTRNINYFICVDLQSNVFSFCA